MNDARHSFPILRPIARWRSLAGAGACLLSVTLGHGQSLIEKSPFLPPDFQAPRTQPARTPGPSAKKASDLELQGIFEIAGKYRFNIFDRQAGLSKWVSLDDAASGYRIVNYDRTSRSIAVELGDELIDLSLKSPTDNPPQAAPPRPAEQTAPAAPPETRRRVVVPPRRVVRPPSSGNRTRRSVPPPPRSNR